MAAMSRAGSKPPALRERASCSRMRRSKVWKEVTYKSARPARGWLRAGRAAFQGEACFAGVGFHGHDNWLFGLCGAVIVANAYAIVEADAAEVAAGGVDKFRVQ